MSKAPTDSQFQILEVLGMSNSTLLQLAARLEFGQQVLAHGFKDG